MPTFIEFTAGQLLLPGVGALQLQLAVLVLLLLVASIVDIRERRIPNWLVASGMVGAIAFHTLSAQGAGAAFAFSGLAVGMSMLLPMYVLGIMGAGDVKLMGMTGAFLGMDGALGAVLASMAAGGVFALAMATSKRMLPKLLANLRGMLVQQHINHVTQTRTSALPPEESVGNMPYALAITVGTLAQLIILHY